MLRGVAVPGAGRSVTHHRHAPAIGEPHRQAVPVFFDPVAPHPATPPVGIDAATMAVAFSIIDGMTWE